MSSGEFSTIFKHAAGIVKIQCRNLQGVDAVIAALSEKICSSIKDPRENRDLFFEPWLDAQTLSVPVQTAEQVALCFLSLSILKIWTRVSCPSLSRDEDGIYIETDSTVELNSKIIEPCPHCGIIHSLETSIKDILYAINFPENGYLMPFENKRLRNIMVSPNKSQTISEQQNNRLAAITGNSEASLQGQSNEIVQAFYLNSITADIPSAFHLWSLTWKYPFALMIVYLLAIPFITVFAGFQTAILITCLVALFLYIVLNQIRKHFYFNTTIQRTSLTSAFSLSSLLFLYSQSGIQISFEGDLSDLFSYEAMHGRRFPFRIAFGDADHFYTIVAFLLILAALLFVLIYDGKIGWFTSK